MHNPFSRQSSHSARVRLAPAAVLLAALLFALTGCATPRTKSLTDQKLKRLDSDARVDIYVGKIQTPHQNVAIIESDALPYVDDQTKLKQIDQLRDKARRLGANAVQDVHILTKHIRGYMADEQTPFASLRQGKYELYFMRGTAVKVADKEPASLDELRPKDGWVVERLPVPSRLESTAVAPPPPPPVPGLRKPPAPPASSK